MRNIWEIFVSASRVTLCVSLTATFRICCPPTRFICCRRARNKCTFSGRKSFILFSNTLFKTDILHPAPTHTPTNTKHSLRHQVVRSDLTIFFHLNPSTLFLWPMMLYANYGKWSNFRFTVNNYYCYC